jgi:hypothetical protein
MPNRSLLASLWRGFLLLLVLVLVVVHVGAGWVFSSRIIEGAFTPPDGLEFGSPTETALAIDEVKYDSPLGPIDAWYVPGTRSQWVIHIHGKGAPLTEAIPTAEVLAADGYPQLIIGYRNDPGQPADPSGYYEFGRTEWQDLAGAVDWAVEEGATEIALFGYSTGAAIALSYHYKTPDAPVRAMVLQSPNADMEATIDFAGSQEYLFAGIPLPFTVTEIAKTAAALRTSINWESLDYVRRLDGLFVPTLVFHGTADMSVPLETSQRMAAASPQLVSLVTVEGAGHVQAREAGPDSYDQRVSTFLSAHWR